MKGSQHGIDAAGWKSASESAMGERLEWFLDNIVKQLSRAAGETQTGRTRPLVRAVLLRGGVLFYVDGRTRTVTDFRSVV